MTRFRLLRRARDDAGRLDGKGSARGSEEGDGAQSPQSQQSPAKDSAAEAEEEAAAAAAAEKEKAEKEKAEREKAEKEKAEKEKAAVRCRPLLPELFLFCQSFIRRRPRYSVPCVPSWESRLRSSRLRPKQKHRPRSASRSSLRLLDAG